MRRLAVIKGMMAAIIAMLIMLFFSYYMPFSTSRIQYLPVMGYEHPISLTNDNVVDVLAQQIDTRTLHAISIRQGKLYVELLLSNEEPYRNQIYEIVPAYIKLAFQKSDNVKELRLSILQSGRKEGEELQLMQLTLQADDAWLAQQGVQALQDVDWLEHAEWMKRLRIEKSIFWLPQYEV